MIKEKITYSLEDKYTWICFCGNKSNTNGFYPCDTKGTEIEPESSAGWNGLYICSRCGRIINQDTLEVLGKTVINIS